MKNLTIVAVLLLVAVSLCMVAGCDKKTATPPAASGTTSEIGIIDAERLYTETGWIGIMNAELKRHEDNLNTQIGDFVKDLVAIYTKKADAIAEKYKLSADNKKELFTINVTLWQKLGLSNDDINELLRLASAIRQDEQSALNAKQQLLLKRRGEMMKHYNVQLQSYLRDLAEATNVRLIMQKVEQMVYIDEKTTDLTAKLIKEIKAKPITPPEPAATLTMPFPQLAPTPTGSSSTQPQTQPAK